LQITVITERKAGAVLEFLKANAKVPFEAPDIPDEEGEEAKDAGEGKEADVKDEL